MNRALATQEGEQQAVSGEPLRLFTFWVERTLYGVEIAKVLSVSQEMKGLRPMPGGNAAQGLLGMIEFQKSVVPVVDFANALGLKSGVEVADIFVEKLRQFDQDHVDWMAALEKVIKEGGQFSLARDPHECAFGKWYDSFSTHDETLKEILEGFDGPHKRIHALADELPGMVSQGHKKAALKRFAVEREVTMGKLIKRFALVRSHVKEQVRQVFLYVTEDGLVPDLALRIDHIHDVREFDSAAELPVDRLSAFLNRRAVEAVKAFMHDPKRGDCLLIDPAKLVDLPLPT